LTVTVKSNDNSVEEKKQVGTAILGECYGEVYEKLNSDLMYFSQQKKVVWQQVYKMVGKKWYTICVFKSL